MFKVANPAAPAISARGAAFVAAAGLAAVIVDAATIAAEALVLASLLRAATGARAGAGPSARIDRQLTRERLMRQPGWKN